MTRGGRRRRFPATMLVVAALATGCSTGPDDAGAMAPHASASTPAVTSRHTAHPKAPAPGDLTTPARNAGPLSRSSFPTPRDLGAGWRYSVDPGDAEEGYLGNGTPALARDPQEIVQTALPLGCARRAALPVPGHALEVDYTYRGTSVISVRAAFDDVAAARTFYDRRRDGLAACLQRSGGQAVGPLVTLVVPVTATALLSDRTPASDPWSELAVLDLDQVVLVAAHTAPGRPPLAGRHARALARTFARQHPPGKDAS